MKMVRTTVYLTAPQAHWIDECAAVRGITTGEFVRRIVDEAQAAQRAMLVREVAKTNAPKNH